MLKSTISNNSPGHSHNEHTFKVGLSSDICPGIILKRNIIIKRREIIIKRWKTRRKPQEEVLVRAVAIAFKVFWLSNEVGKNEIVGNLTIGIVNRTEGIAPMRKANRMLSMAVLVNKALMVINPTFFLIKRGIIK